MARIQTTKRNFMVKESYMEIAEAVVFSPKNDFIEVTEVMEWVTDIPPYKIHKDSRKVLIQKAQIVEIMDEIIRDTKNEQ